MSLLSVANPQHHVVRFFHSEEEVRSDSIYRFLSINNSVASPDYMLVVNQGFLAIKAQLEDRMRSIGSAVNRSSMDEANFCKSAIYACDAALLFCTTTVS